jgi:hypothetical protein
VLCRPTYPISVKSLTLRYIDCLSKMVCNILNTEIHKVIHTHSDIRSASHV